MSLTNTAQSAADNISQLLASHGLSDKEKAEVLRIVGASLAEAIEKTAESHKEVTRACCGPKTDIAHQISDQVERNTRALITNLMALR